MFSLGHAREAREHVWSPTEVLADVGRFEYTMGSGEDAKRLSTNFLCFRLPRPVPHMVLTSLDSTAGRPPVSLPEAQRVQMGEPFDSRYRLYAPAGYAPDAFRLLPPDLMAKLMDIPGWFHIEFVDSWMFLYTGHEVDLSDPTTWQLIVFLQDALVSRAADVAASYTDDRVTPRTFSSAVEGQPWPKAYPVADQGRRLRSRPSPLAIIGMVALMLVIFFVASVVLVTVF